TGARSGGAKSSKAKKVSSLPGKGGSPAASKFSVPSLLSLLGLAAAPGLPAPNTAPALTPTPRPAAAVPAAGVKAATAVASGQKLYGTGTVKTDKDDYPPCQTVTITGIGWQPGETVTL